MVFIGHAHNYQQFIPTYGVVHIVIRGGGGQFHSVEPDELTSYAYSTHHIFAVTIDGNVLMMETAKPDQTVFDSLTLIRR